MKKAEIKVGGLYTARISGNFVTVRVDNIREIETYRGTQMGTRDTTVYDITNLTTNRKTTFRSAAKFRGVAPLPTPTRSVTIENPIGMTPEQIIGKVVEQAEGEQGSDHTHLCANPAAFDSMLHQPIAQTAIAQESLGNSLAALIAAANAAPIRITGDLTQQQKDILAAAKEIEGAQNNGQRVMVIGAGAGCLAADTMINVNRAGKSLPMTLSRVVAQFSGDGFNISREYMMGGKLVKSTQRTKSWDLSIPTYVARAEGEVIKLGRLVNAWCSGERETYTVTTNTGRSIRATAIHPFLMDDGGWKRLEDIKVGDGLQVNSGRSIGGRGAKIQYKMSDTVFHPNQVCRSIPRNRYGVPTHRLIVEANENGLTLREYLWILRCERDKSALLHYLPPEAMVHHKNSNTMDNSLSNLEVVSGQKEHSNQHEWVNNVLWQVGFEDVVSIELYGVEPTYDLEVENDPHNFLANGFVVHNTGKTFTLKQLEQVLQGNGQYTAFNSSLVAESKAKFKRAACNTTHSLAFRAVGCQFKHRLGGARVKSWEVADRLGIKDFVVELPEAVAPYDDGKPQIRTLKAAYLAGQVMGAIRKFCQSADTELTAKHFQKFDGIDEPGKYTNNDRVRDYLLGFAKEAWADLSDPKGTLPYAHDYYVKSWEMGKEANRPVIAADYILLDEAQDTAPVMLSILQQQTHAMLILVGDDNQSIYQWRGAINAMASFPGAPRKLLSQSFRFGQVVADVANSILGTLDEPTDLVMSGLPTIPSRVCPVDKPKCYLYRTNAGALGKMMNEVEAGRKAHIIGKVDDIISFCRAALDLQMGKGTVHPELGCFTKWAEVQEYSKEDEGQDLRLMVKLIDDFKADRIIRTLDNMPSEDRADTVISTAHRSKGREWSSVRLGQDFKTVNKLDDAERRLLYVACTRAMEELDLTQCPTFCGGYDKGPESEGKEFIPGLEITYTVPMPSVEDLAEYRAKKSAQDCPKIAPISDAGQIPAQAAPDAAVPAQAPANGNQAFLPEGQNIWTKGRKNDWLVRGKCGQSGRITVTRRNGTTSEETIRRVIWEDRNQGVALYEV